MKKGNYLWIIIIAVIVIITVAVILFFTLHKKDKFETDNWDCNADTEECHPSPTGPYTSKRACLKDRNKVCGKNAWDCNLKIGCHADPYGGPYNNEQDCIQNSPCKKQPNVPFDLNQVNFNFTPFGKNSCCGPNCPNDQVNPGFYKICMLGNLQSPTLTQCNQEDIVNYIVDNYNCISPPITQFWSIDGSFKPEKEDPVSQRQNEYFADVTRKVIEKAASKGKLIVNMPIIYGTAAIIPLYANLSNSVNFKALHDLVTFYYDKKFIKGIVYDIETWDVGLGDPAKDGACPRDGTLANLAAQSKCESHVGDVHQTHLCCLYYYLGSYLNVFAKTWKSLEPTWEVYINTYLDSQMLRDDALVSLSDALKNNDNLGIQLQDYFRVDPRKNGSIEKLRKELGGASKMVWGFGGTTMGGSVWSQNDLNQTLQICKDLNYYGLFVWSGVCFAYINNIIPNSCGAPDSQSYQNVVKWCTPN
jgi:hypothetical protein